MHIRLRQTRYVPGILTSFMRNSSSMSFTLRNGVSQMIHHLDLSESNVDGVVDREQPAVHGRGRVPGRLGQSQYVALRPLLRRLAGGGLHECAAVRAW